LEKVLYPNKLLTILVIAGLSAIAFLLKSLLVVLIPMCYFIARLFPSLAYLKLTRKGFEYRNILPAKFIKWSDVDHFAIYDPSGIWKDRFGTVGWVYTDLASTSAYWFLTSVTSLPRSVCRLLRLSIDDGFTLKYGMDAISLVRLLEQWHRQHNDVTWVHIGNTPS
jgi:aryl carrier-like protein